MEILAQISGEALVHGIIFLIILGLVFWLLWWLVSYTNPPEPFNKIIRVVLAIAAVIILINVLLSWTGHPLIKWSG